MITALIADDEHHVRRLVLNCLRTVVPHVSVVAEASDGEELLELGRKHRPDLMIVDIMMPKMDGLRAAEQLRAELPDAKLIFLTAYDRFEFVQKALRMGAVDFLLKPVRKGELTGAVQRLLAADDIYEIPETAQAETVRRASRYVDDNFARPLPLKEVADHVHVSPCHFSRVFRKVTGRTFSSYLLAKRIDVAKRLLVTTNRPCQVIAIETGFRSCGHFSTVFKRESGVSPSTYRAQHRK